MEHLWIRRRNPNGRTSKWHLRNPGFCTNNYGISECGISIPGTLLEQVASMELPQLVFPFPTSICGHCRIIWEQKKLAERKIFQFKVNLIVPGNMNSESLRAALHQMLTDNREKLGLNKSGLGFTISHPFEIDDVRK